jgi:hypothetical protein
MVVGGFFRELLPEGSPFSASLLSLENLLTFLQDSIDPSRPRRPQ